MILERQNDRRPSQAQVVVTIGLIASLVYAGLRSADLGLAITCPWRILLEIPCAGCGTTPALQHLLFAEPLDAFLVNPLATLLTLFAAAITVLALFQLITGRGLRAKLSRRGSTMVFVCVLLAVIANWIYVYLTWPH